MKGAGNLKIYVDKNALQDYTTKLIAKEKTIFATKNEVGSPLVASTVAGMTDHDKIYVYVGSETGYTSGNWYYWDGTAWTSGGIYNSEGFVLDDTLTSATLPAQAKAVGDAVGQLSEETDDLNNQVFATSYNLCDCNDASKWRARPGKDVTISIPAPDTVRITSNIAQAYASAYYDIDVSQIDTLLISGGGNSGTGVARARLYSNVDGVMTLISTITTAWKTYDVSEYSLVTIELNATTDVAATGYVDYTRILAANSSVDLPYIPYGRTSKIESLENDMEIAMDYVITAPEKEYYIHRGARLTAPENTMPAFILARQLGYRFIETDVRYTSDGVPVLIHDGTINRTARNADGSVISTEINIADITYEQALTYDFGIYKGQQYAGTKIPTLAEFLAWCKMTGEIPVLEQKIRNLNEVDAVISALQAAGITEHFVSLSQGIGSLERIYNSLPGGKFMYLINTTVTADDISDAANSVAHPWIMSNYELLTDEIVTACRNSGVKLGTGLYTKFSDIYNTNDYSVAYIVEENTI